MPLKAVNQTFVPGPRLIDGTDLNSLVAQVAATSVFGNSQALGATGVTFGLQGDISLQIVSAGSNPAATGADKVLAVFSIPASSFDVAGRGVNVVAAGSFAANGNTKDIKIIFNPSAAVVGSTVTGGTTIADTGAVTTNGGGWVLNADVFKYGAAGSNTQIAIHNQAQVGGAVAALIAPGLITAAENGAILVAVTGNATTATTDIVFNFLQIVAMN